MGRCASPFRKKTRKVGARPPSATLLTPCPWSKQAHDDAHGERFKALVGLSQKAAAAGDTNLASMRRLLMVVLVLAIGVGLGFLAWRARPQEVPRQADALEQYFYARTLWFEPGFRARGAERQRWLREAVRGMQAVVDYFPERQAVVTRTLAEYDSGLAYRGMGETARAREAFLRVRDARRFTQERGPDALHAAGRNTLNVIIDAAQRQLRELDGRV